MNGLLAIIEGITLLSVVKFLMVTLLIVYTTFALLMMRQISAMTKAVTIRDDFVIRLMGTIHFVFAILVLIISLVLL